MRCNPATIFARIREAGFGNLIGLVIHLFALGILLTILGALTDNTGNILAWGFHGLPSLEDSLIGGFLYEFTHTTGAFGTLLFGLWLSGLVVVLAGLFHDSVPTRRLHRFLLVLSLSGFFVSALLNTILFQFPDPDSWQKYLRMFVVNPLAGEKHQLNPSRFFFLCWPAAAAIVGLAIPVIRRSKGYPLACISAFLSVPFPWFAANYFSYHFLCFADPDRFGLVLGVLKPLLLILPPVLSLILARRTGLIRKSPGR